MIILTTWVNPGGSYIYPGVCHYTNYTNQEQYITIEVDDTNPQLDDLLEDDEP